MAQRTGGKVVQTQISPGGGRVKQHSKLTVSRVRRAVRNNRLSGKVANG